MKRTISLALAHALIAQANFAQAAEFEDLTPAMSGMDRAVQMGLVEHATYLDLERWTRADFHKNISTKTLELTTAYEYQRFDVFLDIAEVFLSQMLLVEAKSVLQDIESDKAYNKNRWQALSDAVDILTLTPIPDDMISPLFSPAQKGRNFWRTLNAIASGDASALQDHLRAGIVDLTDQSPAVVEAALPALTEAAIELDRAELAAQLIHLFDLSPHLGNSSVSNYLRGRAAFEKGDLLAAWEYYALAAQNWDRYAARARIDLVDIALADGQRETLLAAQAQLEFGREAWRGDQYELQVLQREAELHSMLSETFDALMAYGRIIHRFPNTEASIEAGEKAARDMSIVYRKGAEGGLKLSDWLNVHFQLVPIYRYFADFGRHTVFLADHLLAKGATDLAVAEYRRALGFLEERALHAGDEITAEELTAVRLKIATAYADGGQPAAAEKALMEIDLPSDLSQSKQLYGLLARVRADLGDRNKLLETPLIAPDASNLRNTSRALWHEQRWEEAVMLFNRLWIEYPAEFRVDDATYLLLASRRANDTATAIKVTDAFPELTASIDLQAIAKSLLDVPAELEPLQMEAVSSRLNSLDRTLSLTTLSGLEQATEN